jgi:tripartite-type tricarboxylate transporter receptor subunit TctC
MRYKIFLLVAMLAIGTPVFSGDQYYPDRPVRMLVPFPPGGGIDIAARVIAQRFNTAFGQPIIVDNRPGSGGNIAMAIAAQSQPDGYTLIMSAAGPISINVSLYPSVPFDPVRDFVPIALVASTVYVLVLHPSAGPQTVKELIQLAKKQPGKLTFASAGSGTSMHLTGELFKIMAAVDIVHVPFRGSGPALNDLLGNHVGMMFGDIIATAPYISAGKLRGIAVSAARRSPLLPDLPTLSESSLPGFVSTGWTGLLAPSGTPRSIVNKLNSQVVHALSLDDVKHKLGGDGREFGKNSPDQFSDWIQKEIVKWHKVIRVSGASAGY